MQYNHHHTMNELIQDVREWFHEKGIINKSGPLKQLWKTQEEITETRDAHVRLTRAEEGSPDAKMYLHELKDGIGDVCVTLIGVCEMEEFDFAKLLHESDFDADTVIGDMTIRSSLDNLQYHLNEARDAVISGKPIDKYHGIGCMIYDLTGLCYLYGVTLEECLQQAYDVISTRTGRMENGIFVKDSI